MSPELLYNLSVSLFNSLTFYFFVFAFFCQNQDYSPFIQSLVLNRVAGIEVGSDDR